MAREAAQIEAGLAEETDSDGLASDEEEDAEIAAEEERLAAGRDGAGSPGEKRRSRSMGFRQTKAVKSFRIHITEVRVQNLERRKRDLQLQFALGVPVPAASSPGHAAGGAAVSGQAAAENGSYGDRARPGGRVSRLHRLRMIFGGGAATSAAASAATSAAWSAKNSGLKAKHTEWAEGVLKGGEAQFQRTFTAQWRGQYAELEHTGIKMTLCQRQFGAVSEVSSVYIPFGEIAAGSIKRDQIFAEHDGRTSIDAYHAYFVIRFEEIFLFTLSFSDW